MSQAGSGSVDTALSLLFTKSNNFKTSTKLYPLHLCSSLVDQGHGVRSSFVKAPCNSA
jgi:hypothetical protein